jgi:hypothetical protein
MHVSLPVWLMPEMAAAITEKELIDEKAVCQSLPRLQASGPAGASSPLPLSGAAQLLTLSPSLLVPLSGPMISWFCAPARAQLIPHGGAEAPPCWVVSIAQRLPGAGAVSGTGERLPSAADRTLLPDP